jgi:hypothetical protein
MNKPVFNLRLTKRKRQYSIITIYIFCSFLSFEGIAQSSKNSFHLTIGVGGGISINYENIIYKNEKLFITGGGGIGLASEFKLMPKRNGKNQEIGKTFSTFSQYATINFGKKKKFFELGLGAIEINDSQRPFYLFPLIAYRIQPLIKNKINFRLITCVPFGGFEKDAAILFVPFGFSIGYCF